jgi:hypothetical protein
MSLRHYLSPQNKYFGFVWLEGIKIKVHFAGTKFTWLSDLILFAQQRNSISGGYMAYLGLKRLIFR